MFAGFDYGTSHCSIGLWLDDAVSLVALENNQPLLPSTMHAPQVRLQLPLDAQQRLRLDSKGYQDLRFGEAALAEYLQDPTKGYFVKSPKSFLGAAGLSDDIRERFVTVVAAMMGHVKQHADAHLRRAGGESIESVVVGRPVNFQGLGGRDANAQAVAMLTDAARRAGFRHVAFQFEPMAAALEYEARLVDEEEILVIDIGGGTTDCSFVRVGGARRDSTDRDVDVLGHSGERRGGNDYDQALALHAVMPEFGFGDELRSGLPVPNTYFVDAVSTNDVNAQQRFYSKQTAQRLEVFSRDAIPAYRCNRLFGVQQQKASYRLLRNVEMSKIRLSECDQTQIDFASIEQGFVVEVCRTQLRDASERLLEHLRLLIDEVVAQAGIPARRVYLTGGMAKASIVRDFLQRTYPEVVFIDSDHFVSVTEGLTLWARRLFAQA